MTTLWKKDGVDADLQVMRFTVGEDAELDNRLLPFDIVGTAAHARGLEQIGLLDAGEADALVRALAAALDAYESGEFRLSPEDEDAHSALEKRLTAELGEVGRKVHAGRSRNDQVLTALRLCMKDALLCAMRQLASLARATCELGSRWKLVPLPGTTHMQRAMPSTVGFWYASFAEGWADVLEDGRALFSKLDASPLGAAAGYGAPLPLDRGFTASLMGFGRVQVNAQAVQNSRGRLEAALIGWLAEASRDVEKMAIDLLTFSSAEHGFVRIPETLCTGSSIMPQKRNPDVLELLRGTPSTIFSLRDEVERVIAKLPSSYNRDFQLTKGPMMRAVDRFGPMIAILHRALPELAWDEERLAGSLSVEMFATHRALELVREGLPFRDAYRQSAAELRDGDTGAWPRDPAAAIAAMDHLGAPANPGLDEALTRVNAVETWTNATSSALTISWNKLLETA
jgi:argininosuccinate lyase